MWHDRHAQPARLKRLTREEDQVAAALQLVGEHGCAVLIKGGHEEGDALADALIEERQYDQLAGPADRHDQHARHRLHAGERDRLVPGRGLSLADAVARAREFVRVRCTRRRGWGRAPARSGRRACGSTSGRAAAQSGDGDRHQLRRSVDFYRALGLRQIVDSPHRLRAVRDRGRRDLSVQIDPDEKIIATTAIYLECDDLDERVERLARSGIAFEHGPRNQPWMWREARLRDPDGNIIFLYKAGESRRFPPWRMRGLVIHRRSCSHCSFWRTAVRLSLECTWRDDAAALSFKLELDFPQPLAGVDEAGCAPLAGPVVAGACILDRDKFPRGIDDSARICRWRSARRSTPSWSNARAGASASRRSRRSTRSTSIGRGCWR